MIRTGLYRHFKGSYYRVVDIATHSETEEVLVVYQALYGDKKTWVRPLSMFDELIERDGKTFRRFSLCEQQSQGTQLMFLDINAGQSHLFEKDFCEQELMLRAQRGYCEHRLRRSSDKGGRYVLEIFWEDVQQNVERFEKTADFNSWLSFINLYCLSEPRSLVYGTEIPSNY